MHYHPRNSAVGLTQCNGHCLSISVHCGPDIGLRYRGYENWPKVKGTVDALEKIKCIRTDTRGPFYAVISYSYQVEGEYYSGEWDSPTFRLEKEALEFAETYMPKESNVQVLHHPTHPERSTLQVDPRLGHPDYLTELKL